MNEYILLTIACAFATIVVMMKMGKDRASKRSNLGISRNDTVRFRFDGIEVLGKVLTVEDNGLVWIEYDHGHQVRHISKIERVQ